MQNAHSELFFSRHNKTQRNENPRRGREKETSSFRAAKIHAQVNKKSNTIRVKVASRQKCVTRHSRLVRPALK